jgi:hypothetical protein
MHSFAVSMRGKLEEFPMTAKIFNGMGESPTIDISDILFSPRTHKACQRVGITPNVCDKGVYTSYLSGTQCETFQCLFCSWRYPRETENAI